MITGFPLALLGFVLLGVVATRPLADFAWLSCSGEPERQFLTRLPAPATNEAHGAGLDGFAILEPIGYGWYGLGAVLAVFVVTVAWVCGAARRLGAPVPASRLATVTLAGGGELALGYLVLEEPRHSLGRGFAGAWRCRCCCSAHCSACSPGCIAARCSPGPRCCSC